MIVNDEQFVSASSIFEQKENTQENAAENAKEAEKKSTDEATKKKDATVRPFAEAYHEMYY